MNRSNTATATVTAPVPTRIKICGLTQREHVQAAVDAGADAVGFMRYGPSARFITARGAAALALALPSTVTPVFVFVDPTVDEVKEALEATPHALLQFHGRESPGFCDRWRRPYLRAVAVRPGIDLLDWLRRFRHCNALLLDAPVDGHGGGGKVFDWSIAASSLQGIHVRAPRAGREAGAFARLPIVLSGGLNAANVIDGVRTLRPLAVDVSSGVERARGVKDPELIHQFCEAVRRADALIAADPT